MFIKSIKKLTLLALCCANLSQLSASSKQTVFAPVAIIQKQIVGCNRVPQQPTSAEESVLSSEYEDDSGSEDENMEIQAASPQGPSQPATIKMTAAQKKCSLSCLICSKTFPYQSKLKRHLASHTGEKSYKCTICDKTFVDSGNLEHHKTSHSDERLYPCGQCGKKFKSKIYVKKHQGFVHSDQRPYACTHPDCNQAFKNPNDLKRHQNVHSDHRPYACTHPDCNQAFKSKTELTLHQSVHSDQRPYACNKCLAAFKKSSDLRKHQDVHSDQRLYLCDKCNKSYKSSGALRNHKKTHK